MRAEKLDSLCSEAIPYLFEILSDVMIGDVPANVLSHVRQCSHCQSEIENLRIALQSEEPEDDAQRQKDKAVAASLDLQYFFKGTKVGCRDVKSFLPGLADPLIEIRVPTPITVHIDNCRQCAEDLEAIRKLHLTHVQLCRLGQVFADERAIGRSGCIEAQKVIPFVAKFDLASFPAEVLKHLCKCRRCLNSLYVQRNVELACISNDQQHEQPLCGQISPREIFEYVIPYGIDLENEEDIRFRKSLASHVLQCSGCLKKVQQLHKTLVDIIERPESKIVTRLEVRKPEQGDKSFSSPYANWPIDVEVSYRCGCLGSIGRRLSAINPKSFIKPAAAAVILFALVLYFFNAPFTQATDLAGIYKAVAKMANIHIARFVPGKAAPTQEQWISRTLNVSIFKTQDELVLWDISNNSRRVKNIDTGKVEKTPVSGNLATDVRKDINGSLGLLPFENISELPADAKWQELIGSDITSADVKVYDLTWNKTNLADLTSFRWRVFVDTKTSLPQRVEHYQKLKNEDNYVLISCLTADYLSESQMRDIIKDSAF